MAQHMADVNEGDIVEVDIVNNCPLGGSTQLSTFKVAEVTETSIRGVDNSSWEDTCEVTELDSGVPRYNDSAKSGEVEEVRVMETDDGVIIHGSGTVVA